MCTTLISANAMSLSFTAGTLLLEGHRQPGAPQPGGAIEWHSDDRVAAWRCDALGYPALRSDPRFLAARITDNVPAWHRIVWPKRDLRKLRPDQQGAVASWNRTPKTPTQRWRSRSAMSIRFWKGSKSTAVSS